MCEQCTRFTVVHSGVVYVYMLQSILLPSLNRVTNKHLSLIQKDVRSHITFAFKQHASNKNNNIPTFLLFNVGAVKLFPFFCCVFVLPFVLYWAVQKFYLFNGPRSKQSRQPYSVFVYSFACYWTRMIIIEREKLSYDIIYTQLHATALVYKCMWVCF